MSQKPMNVNASERCWHRGESLAEHLVRMCSHVPSGGACARCIARCIAEELSAHSVEMAGGPKRKEITP